MFPRLRTHIAPALLGQMDRLVELSTLGGYGLDETGRPMALDAPHTPWDHRSRDECPYRGRVTPLRCELPARP